MAEARGTSGDLPLLLRGLADLMLSASVWLDVGAAGDASALELHQLHQQIGAAGQRRLLEQRLLGADVERRDLGDGVDQHLVVEPADRRPVDRQPQRVAEPARLALDLGALASATSGGGSLVVERGRRRHRPAIGGVEVALRRSAGSGSSRAGRC